MPKLDLTKTYKSYYNAPTKPESVFFESMSYLTLVGQGEPAGPQFADTTEALYTIAYSIKAICKPLDSDFTVAKLEGQWWVDSGLPALERPIRPNPIPSNESKRSWTTKGSSITDCTMRFIYPTHERLILPL
jgi:hypothetical protein